MKSICGVRLIQRDGILENAWITFENGEISDVGEGAAPLCADSIDGENLYLAPGFIDMHVHGGNGADFLDGTAEAWLAAADFHLSRGTTALCPTFASTTYERMARLLDLWPEVRRRSRARLLPVHLEGPHLAATKAGAQDPRLLRAPADSDIAWLLDNKARISQMTIAPELPNAPAAIEVLSKAGIVMSAGHSEATEREMGGARGVAKVTHLYNAMTYAAKEGLFRRAGLVEYALAEESLACELIADGFHVTPILMKLAYRAKGPSKMALVSDALAGAGLPLGSEFMLGTLACRVAEGVCTLLDGSALSGSATTLIDQVRVVTGSVGVPLWDAVTMAAYTPARILGIHDRYGTLQPRKAADFVLFDDDFEVRAVWVDGQLSCRIPGGRVVHRTEV